MRNLDLSQYLRNFEVTNSDSPGKKLPISYPEDGNMSCYQIEENSFWFQQRNQLILKTFDWNSPPQPFFDIGGGNGFVAKAIQASGKDVVLVEPGKKGVENAQKRGVKNVVNASFDESTFIPNSIPSVGLFDVVEHIENDAHFLKSIYSLLQPGGKVFITVPAYQFLWSQVDIEAGHFRRYRLGQIKKKLKNSGFEIEFSSYFFGYLLVPIFLFRALPYKLSKANKTRGENQSSEEHKAGNFLIKSAINFIFNVELSLIKIFGALPLGASCIIVAKKGDL